MAKSLMSECSFTRNSNKAKEIAESDDRNGISRVELVFAVLIKIQKTVLSTLTASQEIRVTLASYNPRKHSLITQQILFKKVQKGYYKKS